MTRNAPQNPEDGPGLETRTLAALIGAHGHLGDDPERALGERVEGAPREELTPALREARDELERNPRAIFLCAGRDCRAAAADPLASGFDADALPVIETACQGFCDHAPVATLHWHGRMRSFGALHTRRERERVAAFASRCHAAGGLLADDGAALDQRFDPQHDRDAEPLAAFGFLIGHFRGVGWLGPQCRPFEKEVVGRWEAGGRAVCLRMEVAYPLSAGGVDCHEALVVIAPDGAAAGGFSGRAVTDGGRSLGYDYEIDASGTVLFEDRPPGHGHDAARARKLLIPVPQGYEERLEVERDGNWSTYSSVTLLRV